MGFQDILDIHCSFLLFLLFAFPNVKFRMELIVRDDLYGNVKTEKLSDQPAKYFLSFSTYAFMYLHFMCCICILSFCMMNIVPDLASKEPYEVQ